MVEKQQDALLEASKADNKMIYASNFKTGTRPFMQNILSIWS